MMKKLGWMLTAIGALLIVSSILYPLEFINKTTVLILLLGGSVIMFIGSMIRSFSILKK
jgi:hypothetical protein